MKNSLLLRSAFKQLGANIPTTLFMCTGIMIGIAVLIAVVALGQGAQARIMDRVDRVGVADTFTVRTVPWGQGGGGVRGDQDTFLLDFEHVLALPDRLPGIATVLPTLNGRGKVETEGAVLEEIHVQGVALNFLQVRDWNVQAGTFFSDDELESGSPRAVLGPALAAWFFPGENPLGQLIRVEEMELEVSGVLESRDVSGSGRNADEVVLVPQDVFIRLFEPAGLSTVTFMVKDASRLEQVAGETKLYLEEIYGGQEILVRFPMATARARDQMSDTLSFYLTVIAAVALLVGGTVMMNLTSLAVAARTREIGLRKALGARNRDISKQVLLETMLTSLLAGLAGILLGYLLTNELAVRFDMRSLMTWHAPVAGLLFAMLTGLLFGVRPAGRAAQLDPVVALRGASRQ